MGMNTMMLYTFPLQMFHGEQWAAQQKQALDAADAIGMKILMDIEGCENGVSVYFLHKDEFICQDRLGTNLGKTLKETPFI